MNFLGKVGVSTKKSLLFFEPNDCSGLVLLDPSGCTPEEYSSYFSFKLIKIFDL